LQLAADCDGLRVDALLFTHQRDAAFVHARNQSFDPPVAGRARAARVMAAGHATFEHVLGTPPGSVQFNEPELITSTHLSAAPIDAGGKASRQIPASVMAAPIRVGNLLESSTIEILPFRSTHAIRRESGSARSARSAHK
jgi:hypothetical protein